MASLKTSAPAVRLAVIGLLAAGPAGCVIDAEVATATGLFERTLAVDGPVYLDITTGSGDIDIRSGATDSVRIVGRIRVRAEPFGTVDPADRVRRIAQNPPIEQRGSGIRIGDPDDPELRRNVRISYEVSVPPDSRVRSRTGSGDQTIDALRGPLDARGGSGDIRIGRVAGAVDVTTGSGDIEVRGASGLSARTGSGSIEARELSGRVDVRTGSGRIELADVRAEGGEVRTGSGRISFSGDGGAVTLHTSSGDVDVSGGAPGNWRISTSSGDVRLRLPDGAAFDLEASTRNGVVHSDHPVEVRGEMSRRRLSGTVRGGGPLIEVSTSSGTVRVE